MNFSNWEIIKRVLSIILLALILVACKDRLIDSATAADKISPVPSQVATDKNVSITPAIVINSVKSSIAAAAAACAAEPMRGKVYYYCDCGTGAQYGCVAGNDANTGTSPSAPRQTIGNAVKRFKILAVNDTVALCKGGAFDSAGSLSIGSKRCGAGIACNDLREYTPKTFAGTAKPIINNGAGADVTLFNFMGDEGGVRFLNIKLVGAPDPAKQRNRGLFFYAGAHDVTMCNLDMEAFDIPVYNESNNGITNNIKLTGSYITNSRVQGYLGSGNNADINYNYWDGNGSNNVYDHSIYLSSDGFTASNIQVIGNYIHGQYGPTCKGVAVIGHVGIDNFRFEKNVIDIDADKASGSCYGIGFSPAKQNGAKYLRHANLSGNTVINGGYTGFSLENCPDCVIENNLIIMNWAATEDVTGMFINGNSVRAEDDVGNRNIVRNNTIWFGPAVNKGGKGLGFGKVGTGHIVTNNTVVYTATTVAPNSFSCYHYTAPMASFAYVDYNHCFSKAAYEWHAGKGNLASWQSYAKPFDAHSKGGDPLFTNASIDLTPLSDSPLVGAGNVTYKSSSDFTGNIRPSSPAIGAFEPRKAVRSPTDGKSFARPRS